MSLGGRARLLVVLLVGLAVRLVVMSRVPEVHHDEAVNGLMARHVLLGEFPVFFWGQDHAGTLAAFLIAVPFAVLDASTTVLRLVPLGCSLLLVWLASRLAHAVYGPQAAGPAALYAALPPLTLLHVGVTAKDPYAEIPVLGALLLLLTLRQGEAAGPQPGGAAVLGLVAGLAWWTQLLLVPYVAAAGFYLLAHRRWRWLAREATAALPAFLIGSTPLWLHTVLRPGGGLGLLVAPTPGDATAQLGAVIRGDLPALLGASVRWPAPAVNRLVLLAIAAVYLPALAVVFARRLRGATWRAPDREGLLLLAAGLVLAADAVSGYARVGGAKYLVPLYAVLPPLLAGYTTTVRRRLGRAVAAVLVLLVLGLHGQELGRELLNARDPGYLARQSRPPMSGLVGFLQAEGIAHVYAHFTLALKLAFDTREHVVAADWYGFRDPRALTAVASAERVALVAHREIRLPDPAVLADNLAALGGTFRRHEVDGFVVFYDFRPPPAGRPIGAIGWMGRGEPPGQDAPRAYDRDGSSWWGSGEPQRSGLAYGLDLGRVMPVSGIVLHPGPVPRAAARGYRVEVSSDGRHWTETVRVAHALPGLHWAGGHPSLDRTGRLEAWFPAAPARYVRVVQTGRDARYWWSIGELFLYAAGPRPPSPGQAAFEVGRRLEAAAGWEYLGASPFARHDWRYRPGTDWDAVLDSYARAIRTDRELEEAHHRLARVLARLEVPPPGDPRRAAVLEAVGAPRAAASEREGGPLPATGRGEDGSRGG